MAIQLPDPGENDWAAELNDSLAQLDQQTVVSGSISGDNLVLRRNNGTTVTAGNVRGPAGVAGASDAAVSALVNNASSQTTQALNARLSARMLWGEYANLPSPSSVAPGVQYAATDVPELYVNTGTAWLVAGSGGNELGNAEVVPLFSNGSTTPADVPGMSVTFIVGRRPIEIAVTARLAISVTTSVAYLRILLDGAEVGVLNYVSGYADIWETHYWSRVIRGLTPGTTHTVKVQLARDAAGTGMARIGGDTTNPNVLNVRTK